MADALQVVLLSWLSADDLDLEDRLLAYYGHLDRLMELGLRLRTPISAAKNCLIGRASNKPTEISPHAGLKLDQDK
jgi:hypothetical protein